MQTVTKITTSEITLAKQVLAMGGVDGAGKWCFANTVGCSHHASRLLRRMLPATSLNSKRRHSKAPL